MRQLLFALLALATWRSDAQSITGYEYWLDVNDATPQRTFVPVANEQVVDLLGLNITPNDLPIGHHKIHYRLKDSNGRWSSVLTKPLSRIAGGPYEITGGEYWFNENPTRQPFTLVPGQEVSATIDPSVTGLALGHHRIHYRLRDALGFWSSVVSRPFSILHGGPHQLVLLRYWSDQAATDPDDLNEVAITPAAQYLDIIDDVLFCNWSTTGQTNVYFQLKDNHAQWSSVLTRNYTVTGSITQPAQPGPISGLPAPPFGSSQTYSVPQAPGAAGYSWTLPDGWSGSSSTNSITVQVGNGNDAWRLCVSAYNGCGASEPVCMDITTNVHALSGAEGISLFPNPTNGQFSVNAPGMITRLLVYNSTGHLVRELNNPGTDHALLDLSGEAAGLYTVRVSQQNDHPDLRVMLQH